MQGLSPLADYDDMREAEAPLMEHIKSQGRQLRRAREDISALQTPFEARDAVLPELAGEAKTVAIPQDRQYQKELEERPARKRKEKRTAESGENSAFIQKQAEKALKRINAG